VLEKKIETVRFIGYLLETNGTAHVLVRDKSGKKLHSVADSEACAWCLHGARFVAFRRLKLYKVWGFISPRHWDGLNKKERKKYINKLKTYDGTQDLSCV
jgi:hypothetical protein